jgi:hypothetical protein
MTKDIRPVDPLDASKPLQTPTEQVQQRIEEIKAEDAGKPVDKKYCPLMSIAGHSFVACLEGNCAVWNHYYQMCAFLAQKA